MFLKERQILAELLVVGALQGTFSRLIRSRVTLPTDNGAWTETLPLGKKTDTRLYLNHRDIRWVGQKHGLLFVKRTSIIKKDVDTDQEIGTGSLHHSTIHSAVNLGNLCPSTR